MNYIEIAKNVFNTEIEALQSVRDNLGEDFIKIIDCIMKCEGKLIITGMGKPGHIGQKISATLASLGTPSFFLHPAEALHGDLGMVSETDVVIIISFSGESSEIVRILPNIKKIGAKIIALSGNKNSTLVKYSDYAEIFAPFCEACHMGLAPTSSTTVSLVYGDALAIVLSRIYGFNEENYGLFHPAGSLGKKLILTVEDIMASGVENASTHINEMLSVAIMEISKKGLGMTTIVDDDNWVVGIITDGNLRRLLELGIDVHNSSVKEIMTKNPAVVNSDEMAIDVLRKLNDQNISGAPVVDSEGKLVGTIRLRDILNRGIYL